MKIAQLIYMTAFLLCTALPQVAVAGATSSIDDSYEIFLSSKIKKAATSYRDYPVFWWNFLVVESDGRPDGAVSAAAPQVPPKGRLVNRPDGAVSAAARICHSLGESGVEGIRKLPCHFQSGRIREFADSWLADTALRRDFPGEDELLDRYHAVLAKAALPLPRSLLEWLREDPLDELGALRKKLESRKVGKLEPRGPFLLEPSSGRVLIPVQFDFPPTNSARTEAIDRQVRDLCRKDPRCPGVTLFGAHSGSMENESRIRADINSVSTVGTVSLVLLVFFILWSRRYKLLLLLPILGATVAVAAAITVAVFGHIHAISLSFGPGLVGLAMDYGVHAAFLDPRKKHTWRSNFMALVTSLVIMILLGFSAIPLLRQMMFFGVVGLVLAYAAFYFALTRFPRWFEVEPFNLTPKPWPALEALSWACLFGSALVFIKPLQLDLKHLNYETKKTAELHRWFYQTSGDGAPYNVPETGRVKKWAEEHGVRYEGVSTLLPPIEEQERHLATWREPCARGLFKNQPDAAKFLAPFEKLVCETREPRTLSSPAPAYLSDFTDGTKWTAVLFPADDKQVTLIREAFPDASSPKEMIAEFPKTFTFELAWMLPVSLIGALIFLLRHYRNRMTLALLAYVPFLAGVGAFALMAIPFHLPITFISLMGLLMVFGFSLDYGIFAVDYMCEPGKEREGVWSALAICTATTLAGFLPMAMGLHPVLHHLGHALLWGGAGTFIGTFWGVPAGYRLLYGSRAKNEKALA